MKAYNFFVPERERDTFFQIFIFSSKSFSDQPKPKQIKAIVIFYFEFCSLHNFQQQSILPNYSLSLSHFFASFFEFDWIIGMRCILSSFLTKTINNKFNAQKKATRFFFVRFVHRPRFVTVSHRG